MRAVRVLVVDDEVQVAEIVTRYLELKGREVARAGSAAEAVRLLETRTFDFVLLDVVLPGVTGLQALARMRSLTSAPIHIMSGQDDEDSRKDALLLGAAGFFGKPLDFAAIDAALDALPRSPD